MWCVRVYPPFPARTISHSFSLSLSLSTVPSPSRNVAWPVYDSSKDAVHLDSRLDLSNLFERKDRPHTGIPAYLRDDICRQSREARWKSKSTARGVHARVCKRGKVLLSRSVTFFFFFFSLSKIYRQYYSFENYGSFIYTDCLPSSFLLHDFDEFSNRKHSEEN